MAPAERVLFISCDSSASLTAACPLSETTPTWESAFIFSFSAAAFCWNLIRFSCRRSLDLHGSRNRHLTVGWRGYTGRVNGHRRNYARDDIRTRWYGLGRSQFNHRRTFRESGAVNSRNHRNLLVYNRKLPYTKLFRWFGQRLIKGSIISEINLSSLTPDPLAFLFSSYMARRIAISRSNASRSAFHFARFVFP